MTLTVKAYRIDESTGKKIFLPYTPGKQLAGVEVARTELWGAPIMTELGLKILPTLKFANVDVYGETLGKLEEEVKIIRANMEEVIANTTFGEMTIEQRTQNILDAIQQARQVAGGVVIW